MLGNKNGKNRNQFQIRKELSFFYTFLSITDNFRATVMILKDPKQVFILMDSKKYKTSGYWSLYSRSIKTNICSS